MQTMKETIRRVLSKTCVSAGICALSRRLLPKNGAIILYGHRVQDDDEGYLQGLSPYDFSRQINYLKSHYRFIRLSELIKYLEKGDKIPDNSVVLTFDDGFRDNLINAMPVLENHGIPLTIFLTTGCISSGDLPWSQRLGYIFQNTRMDELNYTSAGIEHFQMKTPIDRKKAFQFVTYRISCMSHVERDDHICHLADLLNVTPPTNRMLTWNQIVDMRNRGVEFGAHTYSHALLNKISHKEAVWEMKKSKDDLREHLSIENPSFCFPGGSLSGALVSAVRELGFRSVFQPNRRIRVNRSDNADPFSLRRVGLLNGPVYLLEAEIDGLFHAIRNIYRG